MAHWQYLKYVARHKWYVFQACRVLGVSLWQAVIHDWSKFLPSEWFPYTWYFYGLPKVGDQVEVDCVDGFGGVATVIETRRDKFARYKVRMSNGYIGETQEFWAHDFEVHGLDEAKAAFDRAWNYHQKRQPHHWQYWLLTEDSGKTFPLKMPEEYVREMVADWVGAGRTITGKVDVANWYAKNAEKMQLHPMTQRRVEELIEKHFASEPIPAIA